MPVTFEIFSDLIDHDTIKEIGKGAYGTILRIKNKFNSDTYAVKVIDKSKINLKKQLEQFEREARILEWNASPYLVKYCAKFDTDDTYYLVMEYLAGGNLEVFLANLSEPKLSEDHARIYAAEIIHGLEELHNRGIIHRDLKPNNILLDRDGHIQITDFGLSEELDHDSNARTFCGTPEIMAPEVILREEYDFSVDWWSFGIVLYTMICGKVPFDDHNRNKLFDKIVLEQPEFPNHVSEDAKNLIKKLLSKDPKRRLGCGAGGAQEIIEHDFFKSIDWVKISGKEIKAPFENLMEDFIEKQELYLAKTKKSSCSSSSISSRSIRSNSSSSK